MRKYSLWRMHRSLKHISDTLVGESDQLEEIQELQEKHRRKNHRTYIAVIKEDQWIIGRFIMEGLIPVNECQTFDEALFMLKNSQNELKSLFVSSPYYDPKMVEPYLGDFVIMAYVYNLEGKKCGVRFYSEHETTGPKHIITHDESKKYRHEQNEKFLRRQEREQRKERKKQLKKQRANQRELKNQKNFRGYQADQTDQTNQTNQQLFQHDCLNQPCNCQVYYQKSDQNHPQPYFLVQPSTSQLSFQTFTQSDDFEDQQLGLKNPNEETIKPYIRVQCPGYIDDQCGIEIITYCKCRREWDPEFLESLTNLAINPSHN